MGPGGGPPTCPLTESRPGRCQHSFASVLASPSWQKSWRRLCRQVGQKQYKKTQSSVLLLSPPSSILWWIFWCHFTSILCFFVWRTRIQGQINLSCSASNTWHHPPTPPILSPLVGIVSLCTRPWGRNIHNRMPISLFLSHNVR